jgi:hypothetical protein
MDVASLEQTSTTNLEETPTIETKFPSTNGVKYQWTNLMTLTFRKKKLEMERELEDAKTLGRDKKRAFQGEALHKEVEVDYEMMELELQRILLDVEALVKEEDNILSQLHEMKTRQGGMCFYPLPIVHPKIPVNDGGKNVVIIKPCGYYNLCYHCCDIAITSCKHTFHPFCLGAMLQKSNKCVVCKQKLHLDWWSSWGIHEKDEEMKELAHDMVNNVLDRI